MGGRAAILWAGLVLAGGPALAADPPDTFPAYDPSKRPVTVRRAPEQEPPAAPGTPGSPAPAPVAPAAPNTGPAVPNPSTLPSPTTPPPQAPPVLTPGPLAPGGNPYVPEFNPNTPRPDAPQPPQPPGPSGTAATTANLTPAPGFGLSTGLVAGPQRILFSPRYGVPPNGKLIPDANETDKDRSRFLYTGGLIVNIKPTGPGQQDVELLADNAVAWIKRPRKAGAAGPDSSLPSAQLETESGRTEVELYLTGNVVIRTNAGTAPNSPISEVVHAAEVYYDATRRRGVFLQAEIDVTVPGLPVPARIKGAEIDQLGTNHFDIFESEVSASRRRGSPGLNIAANRSTFTREPAVARRNIFGFEYRDLRTGDPDVGFQQILTSYGVKPRVYDIPFFYLPKTTVDLEEPLGPLAGFATANDRVLGFQLYTTFDVYKLLALRGPRGHRWQVFADYYGERGPAFGTQYDYTGRDLFDRGELNELGFKKPGGYNTPYEGLLRGYVVNDTKKNRVFDDNGNPQDPRFPNVVDVLGGDRGLEPIPPGYRTRLQFRHNQELYEDGDFYVRFLAAAQYFSDKNFYEQYYKNQFDLLPNPESFAYLYGADGNRYGSLLTQANLERPWVTETEWLPRADGAVIGQSLFDLLTYSTRASAGYAQLRPARIDPLPVVVTDREANLFRGDWFNRVEAPFDLGPVRVSPYGVVDLAYYSSDLGFVNSGIRDRDTAGTRSDLTPGPTGGNSDGRGRFYGAGGVQTSMNVSRLYGDAASELFNVQGLYHKATLRGNYYNAYSDTPYYLLPQLDRLNDDATDQGYRNTRPRQGESVNTEAVLATSPLYDPQRYAIRRLVDNRADTLDSVQVLQLGLDQRLQTKRGFPGAQHTVDWMTLNVSASLFPQEDRDNFGQTAAFYEYYFLWHAGDRTSFTSSGWMDPIENGAKYFNVGVNFARPDGTNLYFAYRQTDPLNSRALTAVISYNLNRKYSVSVISTYDFGNNSALSNQVSIARTGADVTLLFGFSYNSLQNNFGLQLAVIPNLAAAAGGAGFFSNPVFGNRGP